MEDEKEALPDWSKSQFVNALLRVMWKRRCKKALAGSEGL